MKIKDYNKKAFELLIQDLAELWLEDLSEPRDLSRLTYSFRKRIVDEVYGLTDEEIDEKTLDNYLKKPYSDNSHSYNFFAACWLFEMKYLKKKDIQKPKISKASPHWNTYIKILRSREENLLSSIKQAEGDTIEYKDAIPGDEFISVLCSSFANAKGGDIYLGVSEGEQENDENKIIGINGTEPLRKLVLDAIKACTPHPDVEHNWIYYSKENLMVYHIIVKKNLLSRPIKVNGIAYKRDGEKNEDIDREIDSEGNVELEKSREVSVYRFEFHKSHQSIFKIVKDLSKYYNNDQITSPDTLEGKILVKTLYRHNIEDFFIYLSKITNQVLIKTLPHSKDWNVREEAKKRTIRIFSHSINFDIFKLIEYMKAENAKFLSPIYETLEVNLTTLNNVLQIGNLFSRNNGLIDELFIETLEEDNLILGTEYNMPVKKMYDLLSQLDNISATIDKKVIKIYPFDEVNTEI